MKLYTIIIAAVASTVATAFGNPTFEIPESASIFLFGAGLVGIAGLTRRKLKRMRE